MQKAPEPSVVEWLDKQPAESVWITSITLFEAHLGIARLPSGRRRKELEFAFEQLLVEDLEERVLDFDRSAAEVASSLAAERQRKGLTADLRDTQIAGIVIARRSALATRNVKHFADLTVGVVNPWEAEGWFNWPGSPKAKLISNACRIPKDLPR